MRLIIAGSRSFSGKIDSVKLYKILKNAEKLSDWFRVRYISEVVSGTAKGADRIGEDWAKVNGIPVKQFPADWKNTNAPGAIIKKNFYGEYNARAGYDRNLKMGRYADAAIVLWDGESKGSQDMINIMRKLRKPVLILEHQNVT